MGCSTIRTQSGRGLRPGAAFHPGRAGAAAAVPAARGRPLLAPRGAAAHGASGPAAAGRVLLGATTSKAEQRHDFYWLIRLIYDYRIDIIDNINQSMLDICFVYYSLYSLFIHHESYLVFHFHLAKWRNGNTCMLACFSRALGRWSISDSGQFAYGASLEKPSV